MLGPGIARVFADLHRDHGVDFRFGAGVREFRGDGRVSAVLLGDGTELPADASSSASACDPNVELAETAGLAVDNGVVVDQSAAQQRPATSTPPGTSPTPTTRCYGTHLRVEHWATALHSGPAAARSMLGSEVGYDRLPYFYTDQYDLGMEYTGYVPPGGYDTVVVRGDLAKREFIAFWTAGGRVVAGMNVNVWDVTAHDPGPDPRRRAGRPRPARRPRRRPRRPHTHRCAVSSAAMTAETGRGHGRLAAGDDPDQ